MDASGFPTTHANFNVGFGLNLNRTYSPNMNFVPITKTAAFTCTKSAGHYRGDATTAAFTFTLPPAVGGGYRLSFKKIDASVNAVTIDAAGAETIDGALTKVLAAQWDGANLMDVEAGKWEVIK